MTGFNLKIPIGHVRAFVVFFYIYLLRFCYDGFIIKVTIKIIFLYINLKNFYIFFFYRRLIIVVGLG